MSSAPLRTGPIPAATLELALDASGLDKAKVLHRPRLLSDDGSSYITEYITDDLAKWMKRQASAP